MVEHLTEMALQCDPAVLVKFFAWAKVAWGCPETGQFSLFILFFSIAGVNPSHGTRATYLHPENPTVILQRVGFSGTFGKENLIKLQ